MKEGKNDFSPHCKRVSWPKRISFINVCYHLHQMCSTGVLWSRFNFMIHRWYYFFLYLVVARIGYIKVTCTISTTYLFSAFSWLYIMHDFLARKSKMTLFGLLALSSSHSRSHLTPSIQSFCWFRKQLNKWRNNSLFVWHRVWHIVNNHCLVSITLCLLSTEYT